MTARLRWLLFTVEGRRLLIAIYVIVGTITVATYWTRRSPLYALGLAVILAFGLFWIRWCLSRPASG